MSAARPAPRWRRSLLAVAVAVMGVVDLLSALLSHPAERLLALRQLVPTEVLDTSRTYTLLAGALLLVTAWGLARGKRRAYVLALFLCAVSVPVNLLKAFDFEEATVAAALMFALGVTAEDFRVRSRALSFRALRSGAAWAALALVGYAVAGCWVLEWSFGHDASLLRAVREAFHQLTGLGDTSLVLRADLPHFQRRIAGWYLDSLSLTGLTLLVAGLVLALRPVAHRRRHQHERDEVAALLGAHGTSTVSWFALADDTDWYFSANRRAVIAYRFESGTLLAIGDPIGPAEEIEPLLRGFAAFCAERDWAFAFFQAGPALLPWCERLGWQAVHVGEDPVLHLADFTLEGSARGSVRRAARKLEEQGLEARQFVPPDHPFDAASDPDRMLEQLAAISAEWLRERRGGEKGFCMGRFDPARLGEVWVAVAWDPARRRVEGFVTWVPIPGRRGWALDLMRRRSDAPSGVMDFLVARSGEAARARGDALLSLSLSALVQVDAPAAGGEDGGQEPGRAPGAVAPVKAVPREPDRARAFLMRHLAGFYDFEGLFRWKRKFDPAFEDRFLVVAEPLALPRAVLALVRAQSPGGLASYLSRTNVG